MRQAAAAQREGPTVRSPEALYELANRLKADSRFSHGRRVLAVARSRPVRDAALARKLRQRHALCTYKDPDLPADARLDAALAILSDGENLATTTDQETLGLAGAIHKRRWQLDLRRENLEESLHYYRRGHEVGAEKDFGYTSINTAYVLDLLASLEENAAQAAGTVSPIAAERRAEARTIRETLTTVLPPLPGQEGQEWLGGEWWYHATLIEAYFGLGEYVQAAARVETAMAIEGAPEWEYRSTATQLASLATILPGLPRDAAEFETTAAGDVLRRLLGNRAAALRTASVGKIGLALSGGGFRASLYHIGVLAALAEMDLLRHVEVLSCVSGGSILGAHYYLEVKHLLETKSDDEITRDDFVEIVKRLEQDFLEGVQRNIRMHVIGGLKSNLELIFSSEHSRTKRVGDLYEKHLYSRVEDGAGDKPRWMTDLFIRPRQDREDFRPRRDNWRRSAKVPDLVLNATTLNTGHNWRFTASWMGEPPTYRGEGLDTNYTLRRMYYAEAPAAHRCVRLGHAVAASSCVPGLFEPLSLDGLYPGLTVRLVDGGVHDNQGVAALLEEECSVVLVSDASGQMGTEDVPGAGALAVPLRSNSILMSRVRVEQYDELKSRYRSKLLRGLMFVHLKQGLGGETIDWIGCEDPDPATGESRTGRADETGERLQPDLLQRLSAIRTDLDAFSDAEAFSLMYAGWRMTSQAFEMRALDWIPRSAGGGQQWRFLDIEAYLKVPSRTERLMTLLDVGRHRALKVWKLVGPLRVAGTILVTAAVIAAGWLALAYRDTPLLTVGMVAGTLATVALTSILGAWATYVKDPGGTSRRVLAGIALAATGWIIAGIHLAIFKPLFLKAGRIRER
jgi:predicted acylesterase/phospholipase RssA